jgi:Zn-dependent protease with chaperone function
LSILAICDNCQSVLRTKDDYAGRQMRCPKCQGVISVPGENKPTLIAAVHEDTGSRGGKSSDRLRSHLTSNQATAVPPDSYKKPPNRTELPVDSVARYRQLETDVLRAFDGSISPVRVPMACRAGILLIASVMVLLPLIYLSLIGATGYAVYWHAAHRTDLLTADVGGTGRDTLLVTLLSVLLYLAPMIIGSILVLFMFKPLLSRPARRQKHRTLSRENEPVLFAFVDRLCDAVHAPRPKRIAVDLQVSASTSLRARMLSMPGSDLVLTIGLPLVAGLNMRQFACVLAHEFGYFSSGAGIRMQILIRTISHWFTRVVHERDEWDERLTQWSREWDVRVGWILQLARCSVWLTRRILWCLMMIGHCVAGFLLRQMEFDADRHAAEFAGSDAFIETTNTLSQLTLADQQFRNQLGSFDREGRLVDNLPRLIVMNSWQLSKEAHEYLARMAFEQKTRWFDTHPADRDRIATVEGENAPGIFRLKHPAELLFRSFPALCRAATVDLYRELFGREFEAETLASVDNLFANQPTEGNDLRALQRYFQKQFTFYRPLQITPDAVATPNSVAGAVELLKEVRCRMEAAFEHIAKPLRSFKDAQRVLDDVQRARPLLAADIKLAPTAFNVDLSSLAKVERVESEQRAQQEAVQKPLAKFDRLAEKRLTTALSLLDVPEIASRIDESADVLQRRQRLLKVSSVLAKQLPTAIRLLDQHAVMQMCLCLLNDNSEDAKAENLLRQTATDVAWVVRGLRDALKYHSCPFAHAKSEITLADYILAELPDNDDLGAHLDTSRTMSTALLRLHSRTLGGLCLIAEQVEKAIGLPPLSDINEDEDACSFDAG